MKKKKVYELLIDMEDELSGIDSVSLVDEPAIEINFLAFKKDHSCHVPDGLDKEYLEKFKGGQSELELLNDGWVVESMTPISYEEFALSPTNPNRESDDDTEDTRVRYKYDLNDKIKQNPIIPTTREYCRTLLNRNFVWTREELMSLNPNSDPFDGGFGGDPMIWRGGYNCRHFWFKIRYKKEGKIVNKSSININKILDEAGRPIETKPRWNQPSTVTSTTASNPSSSTVKNLGLSKFAVDLEKHIVLGPAMIPDQKILRMDKDGNPYDVFFSAETIKMIAEKYMKNGFNVANDIDHNGKKTKDVYVVESWIKESENDKSTTYEQYKSLPIGTWFISMKVNNDEIWNKVKSKELNGFSVSGWFAEELTQMDKEHEFLIELAKLIKNNK